MRLRFSPSNFVSALTATFFFALLSCTPAYAQDIWIECGFPSSENPRVPSWSTDSCGTPTNPVRPPYVVKLHARGETADLRIGWEQGATSGGRLEVGNAIIGRELAASWTVPTGITLRDSRYPMTKVFYMHGIKNGQVVASDSITAYLAPRDWEPPGDSPDPDPAPDPDPDPDPPGEFLILAADGDCYTTRNAAELAIRRGDAEPHPLNPSAARSSLTLCELEVYGCPCEPDEPDPDEPSDPTGEWKFEKVIQLQTRLGWDTGIFFQSSFKGNVRFDFYRANEAEGNDPDNWSKPGIHVGTLQVVVGPNNPLQKMVLSNLKPLIKEWKSGPADSVRIRSVEPLVSAGIWQYVNCEDFNGDGKIERPSEDGPGECRFTMVGFEGLDQEPRR